jgi:thiol-disulfide isomerase/thioredoxin
VPTNEPDEPAPRFSALGRVWDALALLIVAFALWKIFIAPRFLNAPHTLAAPHAVYQRLEGGTFGVAAQRGRVLVLDFYATWCAPCKLELPLVEAWAARHTEAMVVPVDVGEPRSVAASFARRLRLRAVALDPQASARALFGIVGFPTIVVVDPAGYIRAKWEGLNPAIALALSNAEKKL